MSPLRLIAGGRADAPPPAGTWRRRWLMPLALVRVAARCAFCAAVPAPGHRACADPICQALLRAWVAELEIQLGPGDWTRCACGARVRVALGSAVLPAHTSPSGAPCEARCACGARAGRTGRCGRCAGTARHLCLVPAPGRAP